MSKLPARAPDRALALIAQLRGVTWRWREDAPATAKAQPGIGVIAQDVERVFPELVKTDRLGRKKVSYEGLIAPLIEAVKELDERVEDLEGRLQALETGQHNDGPPRIAAE